MKRIFKYGIYITLIFLVVLTVYNISIIDKVNETRNNGKREHHSYIAKKFNELDFPIHRAKNIVDGEVIDTKIDKGFVILLSNTGCNPCQLKELKNLEEFFGKYNLELIIFGLYANNYDRIEALRLRKLSKVSFPLCYIAGGELDRIYLSSPFPKIFFIENQKILYTLIPIPNDDLYSKIYYNNIEASYRK